MRLHLMRYQVFVIEYNSAGIVTENGCAEIRFAFLFANTLRSGLDIAFEDRSVGIIHRIRKDSVFTVLGPGLRQGFQFNISRLATKFIKIRTNGLQRLKVERQRAAAAFLVFDPLAADPREL